MKRAEGRKRQFDTLLGRRATNDITGPFCRLGAVTVPTTYTNCLVRKYYLRTAAGLPKNARADGCRGFGENMDDVVEPQDAKHLIETLERLLDELDSRNLIQTAAKVASTIDTLKAEIERNIHNLALETQRVDLIRAIELD